MISTKQWTQEQIKAINKVNIVTHIRGCKQTTKQEIAKALGLSVPTVTANITELIQEGLVRELGVADSTGGRKPMILGFVHDAKYAFGVSITKEICMVRMIDLNYDVVDELTCPYEDMAHVLEQVKQFIERCLVRHNVSKPSIVGVGIALPGVVDDDALILEKAPNLGIQDLSFKSFQEALGLPVWIENEANIAAFAELKVGNAVHIGNLVYISITEGIGTGIIIRNHIYKSNKKRAGEFGHTRVTEDAKVCNCGRTGCWELYASKLALMRYYEFYAGHSVATEALVFERYQTGEAAAKKAISHYVKYLFYGLENIILALNPDYMVIGGEFGKYQNILKEAMKAEGLMIGDALIFDDCHIIFSGLEDKGALIGAALLPLESIFNYNDNVI